MIKSDFQTKFDGLLTLKKAINAKGVRVLFKLGAYVKSTMERSMRYRKQSSSPGEPPSAHTESGGKLRKGIGFAVGREAETVVIGPDQRRSVLFKANKPLPQLLNEGGRVEIKGRSVTIAPRPFILPAYEAGKAKFIELIKQEQLRD